jgi:hypothetical protein
MDEANVATNTAAGSWLNGDKLKSRRTRQFKQRYFTAAGESRLRKTLLLMSVVQHPEK